MKNKLKERYDVISQASRDVSDLVKNLAWTGIAIAWVLKSEWGDMTCERLLFCSLFLFASSILFSLLHYLIEVIVNRIYVRETMLEYQIPKWSLRLSWGFWYLKIFSVITAYILISIVLIKLW